MTPREVALSKAVARALRHAPEDYELELDDGGWVPVPHVVDGLRRTPRWRGVSETELTEMLKKSPKQRFEIVGGRIRALYGHSVPTRGLRLPAEPPPLLFHGTSRSALPTIFCDGLLPMRRQFVHLSIDRETALVVAHRKGPDPVVLTVAATAAHAEGVEFVRASASVWLTAHLPPGFLRREDGSDLP